MAERLLTPQEVADRLQVPLRTLYRLRSRGGGPPALTIAKRLRFDPTELEAWLHAHRDGA